MQQIIDTFVPADSSDLRCKVSRPFYLPMGRRVPDPIQPLVQLTGAERPEGNVEKLGHPVMIWLVGG